MFPLAKEAIQAFDLLKKDVEASVLIAIDPDETLTVETDASDIALAATLSQKGRPIAFFTKMLDKSARHLPSIEKEASAVVESLRKWKYILLGRHFTLVTDQQSVAFMFNQKERGKIKNDKIMRWRIELSAFSYDIQFRPGRLNIVADHLSRPQCNSLSTQPSLESIHKLLCHPGVTRLLHYIRSKNLPYSTSEVKQICGSCTDCALLKPRFYRPPPAHTIKATQPLERIAIDFVGPKSSSTTNKFLLVMVDEFSRFPFAYPTKDMSSNSVIKCLQQLFSMFGLPSAIHSDRGAQFMGKEVSNFLSSLGIAQTRTTPYNPACNGQCERTNGTLWKAVQLALRTNKMPITSWEFVVDDALSATRSLLCTSTNATPHERMFAFQRRSCTGSQMPTWLLHTGNVFLKRHVRNKSDPFGDVVTLLNANPQYASIRYDNGRESTVSIKDLAPLPSLPHVTPDTSSNIPDTFVYPDNSTLDDKELTPSTDTIPLPISETSCPLAMPDHTLAMAPLVDSSVSSRPRGTTRALDRLNL